MRMTRFRTISALLAVVVCAAGTAPTALADGDPASDYLIAHDAFYPYSPNVSSGLRSELNGLLKRARKRHYPFKVAMIESPGDLGAYPDMFKRPQAYAKLLQREIKPYVKDPHLLVVMPNGFGGVNLPKGYRAALKGVKVDASRKTNGLAGAAIRAIPRLASLAARQA